MYSGLILVCLVLFSYKFINILNLSSLSGDDRFILLFSYVAKFLLTVFTISVVTIPFVIKIPIHKLFIFAGLGFGLFYMIFITPLSIPDGPYHYFSSLKLSNIITFNFNDTVKTNDLYISRFEGGHKNLPGGYLHLSDPLFWPQGDDVPQPASHGISYPVQILPQTIGLTLARLLGFNFIWKYHMGQLFNLMFFITCIYIAIKKIPFQKALVFSIALLPMTMQQASSFSYDCFINGLSILLVACIMQSIYKKDPISKSEIVWIAVITALLSPAKTIYYFLVFLVLLIPKERFAGKKSHLLSKLVMLGSGILTILIFNIPSFSTIASSEGRYYTLSYVLSNPITTFKMFFDSLEAMCDFYFYSALGQQLSGLTLYLPMTLINLFAVVLFLAGIKNKDESDVINIKQKSFIFVVSFVILGLVFLSLMLGFTPNTYDLIIGVQGRYFIPILLPLLLLLRNQAIVSLKSIDKYVLCFLFLLQFDVLWKILNLTVAKIFV